MSEQISKILDGPFPGEHKGERLKEIAECLKEVQECFENDDGRECDFVHHCEVFKFLSVVIHPSCLDAEETKNYLGAVSFILEMVRRDLENLIDDETGLKHGVLRYFMAAGLEVSK